MDTGSFGFLQIPSSVPVVEDQIAVLRLLGRLEYTLTPQIRHLVYRGTPERTMYRRLEELHKAGYIWRQAVNLSPKRRNSNAPPERIGEAQRKAQTPTRLPYVWGLTPEGKAYLEMTESEPEAQALAGLKTRDRRSPNVPLATLTHDLQASWWCSSVVAEATRNRFVTGIFLQVEFVTAKSQRVDALVGLRIDPSGRERDMAGIPWYDGFGDQPGEHWRWYALEIDRGTEPLAVLLQKAITYRDLTLGGVYEKIVHGRVLPVFIAPTPRRCHQIHQEWAHAWPEGYGAISTPHQADHEEHGTLWGDYWHIVKGQAVGIFPSMRLEQWQTGIQPEAQVELPAVAAAAPTAPSAPAAATSRATAPTPAPTAPAAPTGAPQRPAAATAAPAAAQPQAAPAGAPQRPQAAPATVPTPQAPQQPRQTPSAAQPGPSATAAPRPQAAPTTVPQRPQAAPATVPTPQAPQQPRQTPSAAQPGPSAPAPAAAARPAAPTAAPAPSAPAPAAAARPAAPAAAPAPSVSAPAVAARPAAPTAAPAAAPAAAPVSAPRPSATALPSAAAPAQPSRPAAAPAPTAAPAARPPSSPPTSPASPQPGAAAPRPTPSTTTPAGTSTGTPSGAQSGAAAAAAPATEKAPVRRRVVGFAAPKRQGNKA